MTDAVPDVVPTLAFEVIDFIQITLGEALPAWHKRVMIDTYGAGDHAENGEPEDD